jgi:hypothetical protein
MAPDPSLDEVVLFFGDFQGLDDILSLSENSRYRFDPPVSTDLAWLGLRHHKPPVGHVLRLRFGHDVYSPEGWVCGSAPEIDRADVQIAASNIGGVSRRHFLVDIDPASSKPRLTVLGQMLRVTPLSSRPIVLLQRQTIEVIEPLRVEIGEISFWIWQPTLRPGDQQRSYNN